MVVDDNTEIYTCSIRMTSLNSVKNQLYNPATIPLFKVMKQLVEHCLTL